ncbi:hypothetical protein niasHS_006354 [Heterodera schachtii]|uniref:Phosphoribulokinase/uridine kinase domain-containing protein n=2 Tax=Heterodera TaxID=34509 RepID=A0ABD2JX70_HETSC
MLNTLRQLCQGKSVLIPKYDLKEQRRLIDASHRLEAADAIFGGGHCSPIKVERDTTELSRPLDQVLHQYLSLVKPAYEDFCLPTKKYADVIIPRGAENDVAIDLIVQHIQEILRTPTSKKMRPDNGSEMDGK